MPLLNAETLAKLKGTKLRARALVEGVLSGLHQAPHQGQSVEFAEHKEYAPGDELKHLDWKAFGKFDRYYVKRFEQESNLRAWLLLDASASMNYRSGALSKFDIAKTLAATLAHLTIRQQDAAGLALIASGRLAEVPARSSAAHLQTLLDILDTTQATGSTDLAMAADHLAEKLPRRSVVYVFSDLFDEHEGALKKLLALKARRHDVVVFHVLDRAEMVFPFEDFARFESLEDDRRLDVNPREIRASYLEEFDAFLTQTKQACTAADVEYVRVPSDVPLDALLISFLSQRRRGRR